MKKVEAELTNIDNIIKHQIGNIGFIRNEIIKKW